MKNLKPRVGDEYWKLAHRFPLRPIRSGKELERATEIIDELVVRKRTPDEGAYLDVLSDLVEKYEAEHHPIEDVTDTQMLQHLIEAKHVSQRALAEATGIKESAISDLLAGRRRFNARHIEKLAAYFNVSPAVFFPTQR
jgi:HTH-type transcriptional regulator/antitoxin HigA